ncbi:putative Na+/H+ antiporter [Roseibacillus ishigakijimensis]|uniref:Na+/H+ antiporter n=1 Tax=Roseibacillus ishigakijimensis TaxID=454146 RepID=A0A934RQT6_9BACT|nr:putative Na+/H+ antiporter [Roseibacillus ishigakijimensis]MBK1834192.1 putative Na+/H+ antiporter [Roseibacillus ishigakijimensis]
MSGSLRILFCLLVLLVPSSLSAAGGGSETKPHYPANEELHRSAQYSQFPIPTYELPTEYNEDDSMKLGATLVARVKADPFNLVATLIFICAIAHTFMAGWFNKMAHHEEEKHRERINKLGLTAAAKPQPDAQDDVSFKATILHFFGEVEAIFGIWIIALAAAAIGFYDWEAFKLYVTYDRVFTEPMFVVIIMAIAASRPVLRFAEGVMAKAADLGHGSPAAWWLSVMTIAPILGSFITEPAAMTIGALLLAKKIYKHKPNPIFAYATLGLLFVNVSVGGTLTHFAAPPVLMVASTWDWGMSFMFTNFGYKAVIAIILANALFYFKFKEELARLADRADGVEDGVQHPIAWHEREDPIPFWVIAHHLFFLAWTVFTAHYPALFIGGFLFFLAFVAATQHHQNAISMKGPLLVGFFLGALIIHGGCQAWWIEPIIVSLNDSPGFLMFGATILTAFNDNAAITYLASQVSDISEAAKHAVVAGAVVGGGLTVIANAPNPAGQSILSKHFEGGISPLKLALGALVPTFICYLCMTFLPNLGENKHEDVDLKAPNDHPAQQVDDTH